MWRVTHEKLENVRVILRLLSQWKVIFIAVLTLLSLELRMPLRLASYCLCGLR